MKKKLLIFLLGVSVLLNVAFIGIKLFSNNNNNNNNADGFNDLTQVKHENMLSMMLEQNAGAGDYSLETRSSWPTKEDGYVFNSTLSKCEKGSKLRWDDENNAVIMEASMSDKCYIYFDKLPTLSEWVIAQYTGIQGENNLYYHNGTILGEDGTVLDAEDNSYRYAGASDSVNNFVCFGSSEETCQDNNLYRIIGLFGDRVKLIKWDYANNALLGTDGDYGVTYANSRWDTSYYQRNVDTSTIGTYFWSGVNASASYKETGSYNDWSYSQLNTVNLNTNYLANIRTEWANMIDTTTWKVGGNTYANMYQSNAKTAYTNEITSPSTQATSTYESKVGLMYVSDYYYGASPTYWTYPGYSSSGASYDYRTATGENWMYMGLYEWTMARSSSTFNAFYVGPGGSMSYDDVNAGFFAIRPVFYLNSDVTYISGSGTKSDPICIN